MNADIVLLPGDGIGPEVVEAGVKVLSRVGDVYGHTWRFDSRPIGGVALRAGLGALPADTVKACRASAAVLLGAVGDPSFDNHAPSERPEAGLLRIRRELGVFANLRPARVWPGLEKAGPLKPEILAGTDLIVVRELLGGLYYGQPRGISGEGAGETATNTMIYTRPEIERVTRVAFKLAQTRTKRVVSVDKANVLEVSRLWRTVVTDVAKEFPDVTLTHELVDAAAMKLTLVPSSFDVLVMENLFGDVLSDEAGAVCGSLGLLPSASLGDGPGLFEPVHGSAPTLAGRDVANPIGTLASVAMLLSDGLGLKAEGAAVTKGIEAALKKGLRTADIADPDGPIVGTRAFAAAVVAAI
jgi:3-isopropylmalate dehydrogenase